MIAFSGLDGAGKSTQIGKLKESLEKKNQRVEIFWSRGGYTPGMEFFKKSLRKFGTKDIPSVQGASPQRSASFKKKRIRKAWLTLALLDLILHYSVILRLKTLTGRKIICDRYLFDTELDFQINFPDETVSSWFLWRFLRKTAARPDCHFILTVSVAESQKRSRLKNEPFPDSEDVLSFRLKQYQAYSKLNRNCFHIDCERPIEEVENEINHHLAL